MKVIKSKTLKLFLGVILLSGGIWHSVYAGTGDTTWMRKAKYGIFMHYQHRILLGYSGGTYRLGIRPFYPDTSMMTPQRWNQFVDGFDTRGFAKQMKKAKVGWVIFCLDDHHFAWPCSPNNKFNYYTGYKTGEMCSNRDLIMDVAEALNAKGIKLIVYYVGLNGYHRAPKVLEGLGDTYRGQFGYEVLPSEETKKRRLEILKEYADRYGTKIAGWWFDSPGEHSYDEPPYDWWAIKKIVHDANPNAVIAFALNGGLLSQQRALVKGIDDYTGGDTFRKLDLKKITPENYPAKDGILWHGKIFCGNIYHGQGDANQYTDNELIEWLETCNKQGGICTLDWPFDPNTGLIKEFGFKQMKKIAKAIK